MALVGFRYGRVCVLHVCVIVMLGIHVYILYMCMHVCVIDCNYEVLEQLID